MVDTSFVTDKIQPTLKLIVDLLKGPEMDVKWQPAVEWQEDIVQFLRGWVASDQVDEKHHLEAISEQLTLLLESLRLAPAHLLKTWDYFFTGYIPPLEYLALKANIKMNNRSRFQGWAVYYCSLVATQVADYSSDASDKRRMQRYREQCRDALEAINKLANNAPNVMDATEEISNYLKTDDSWKPHGDHLLETQDRRDDTRDNLHKAAKFLVTVRATLRLVKKKNKIPVNLWHLWIPRKDQLSHAVHSRDTLTQTAKVKLGLTNEARPVEKTRRAKPGSSRQAQSSAASLGSHLVPLNSRQHAIYFG
ncbi:uncharacterized protein JCM6883_005915 [Sporobolomyces salmoneus]|uniref:uncharacterized protein n=1 Tax=Sporobolomyces salmoneus TaxID=183962 RepID=UPI003179343D